ncbi:8-amino-7-oxononanoate synthase [Rubripirellula lacrimiformis]|uniref:8-amino-7-oxononanoate synthase n=1 Tax=Rubripirellula lacrimiformis TaxID=1930273 RepID=A0A517N3G7_9BACT|nr:8-amino-7-oxononanoate synthase [Rubripirellula lacrimiformis]QDT01680.1 8-amino-7-oxononanoate synthase [Rubripirellula lacrimiformis]
MVSDFDHFAKQLDALDRSSRRRRLTPRQSDGMTFVQSGNRLHNFGSNDYLGLASVQSSSPIPRPGATASALVCGWTDAHQRLADQIAELESTEAATVFPTGYAACSGVVATLPAAGDLILSDQLNHASLIDGCRLSPAQRVVYPHRDVAFVEQTLRQKRSQFDHIWIVTDGVFSMDGHIAPLAELCDVADRYDARMIVDEAHGTGVLGDNGSGVCEALGVKSRVPIRIGTLSKAIGAQGGFVAGPTVVMDYLINRCRSLIYSTALAPGSVQAALDAMESIRNEPWRRQRAHDLSLRLRNALGGSTSSIDTSSVESMVPIIPLVIGSDRDTVAAADRLAEAGFFVPAIRPPTVPENTARLRISLSAAHTDDALDQLISLLV